MNHDDAIKREQQAAGNDHRELLSAINTCNDILLGRASLLEQQPSQDSVHGQQ